MNRITAAAALGLIFAAYSLCPKSAGAQFPTNEPIRQPVFGKSPVTNDDSSALVQNPANLAFLPGSELRWSSVYLNEGARVPWQGHALAFAFPIPFVNASTGLRVDLMSPPGGTAPRFKNGGLYQWVAWGLALKASDSFAFGMSLQRSYSDMAVAHGLFGWSLALTSRPSDYFGLAFVPNDINAPKNSSGGSIDRSYDIALAVRPLRSSALEVGFSGKIIDAPKAYWSPSATVGIDIPELGRLRGGVS